MRRNKIIRPRFPRGLLMVPLAGAPPGGRLLDGLSNLTGAYSTRLLSSAYAGDCMLVRRTNGDEAPIGFAADVLDQSALFTFVGSGGSDIGAVETCYDQSGSVRDMTQSNASLRPTICSAGVMSSNGGVVALRYSGSTACLIHPSLSDFVAASAWTVIASAAMIVSTPPSGASFDQARSPLSEDGGGWWNGGGWGLTKMYWGFYENGNRQAMSESLPTFGPNEIFAFTYDGTTLKGYFNGGTPFSVAYAGAIGNRSGSLRMGASVDYVIEAITFDTCVSDATLNLLGASLAEYAGITWQNV